MVNVVEIFWFNNWLILKIVLFFGFVRSDCSARLDNVQLLDIDCRLLSHLLQIM